MIHVFSHYVPARIIILAVLEALVLVTAAYAGISLHLVGFGSATAVASEVLSTQTSVVFALSMVIVMSSMGLYQPALWNKKQSAGIRMAAAFLLGFAVTIFLFYVFPALNSPRPFAVAGILVAALTGSFLVRTTFYKWTEQDMFKSRVLVLGTGSRAMKLVENADGYSSIDVVGFISLQPARHYVPEKHILSVMPGESLTSVVDRHQINQIVVAVRDRRGGGFPVKELLACRMKGVEVVELPTFFERQHRQVLLETLNPSWMVLGDGFRQGRIGNAVKRLFDLVVSGTLLVLTLPIMIVTAVCIYLESGGPVLFRQERVGQGGSIFTIFKFRSMRSDAESCGTPRWASIDDDRATVVGRFIRKVRIDELPQIFNVFRGDMSFVGPRPERPFFVDKLLDQIPYYALRHSAKPGITGWAQIRYSYGATIDDAVEKLQFDLYYVKNRSLFLDIMVLISTIEVVLWGKGAR